MGMLLILGASNHLRDSSCMKDEAPRLVQVQPSIDQRPKQRPPSPHPARGRSGDDADGDTRVGVGHLSAAIKYLEKGQRGGACHTQPGPAVLTLRGWSTDTSHMALSPPQASHGSCKLATGIHRSVREPTAAGPPLIQSKRGVRSLNPGEMGGGAWGWGSPLGSLTVFIEKIFQLIELAEEASANLGRMSKEVRGDSGQPPNLDFSTFSPGRGSSPCFHARCSHPNQHWNSSWAGDPW